MQSIAIFNNKGGVGKTTLLCNLAAFLALRRDRRILIVDADPQCNATQNLFPDESVDRFYSTSKQFTIYSIIRPLSIGRGYSQSLEPEFSESFGVDVVIGDPRLSLTEDLLARDWADAIGGNARGMQTSLLFKNLLSRCEDYDYVIFDMGPSLGAINRSVLVAADFFLTPMSIDIFSLKAIENISISLAKWQRDLDDGFKRLDDEETDFGGYVWKLKFLGYVTQQYTAKRDSEGNRRAVKAFDKILQKVEPLIEKELVKKFQQKKKSVDYHLGAIPTLHSLIPMSQFSRRPIFELRAADGVVGTHFSKVKEYTEIIQGISDRVEENLEDLS